MWDSNINTYSSIEERFYVNLRNRMPNKTTTHYLTKHVKTRTKVQCIYLNEN